MADSFLSHCFFKNFYLPFVAAYIEKRHGWFSSIMTFNKVHNMPQYFLMD